VKFAVLIKEEAERELLEAIDWYETQQPGLGLRLLEDWEQAINYITDYPKAYETKRKNYRNGYLKIFPYAIIYEILKNEVVVYYFKHLKMNPKKRYRASKIK